MTLKEKDDKLSLMQIFLFFYYIGTYSIGLITLGLTLTIINQQKQAFYMAFFITTLLMTIILITSTIQNYLPFEIGSFSWRIILLINYAGAILSGIAIIHLYHLVYPWSGFIVIERIVKSISFLLCSIAIIFVFHPNVLAITDIILGFKNMVILYAVVLGLTRLRQKNKSSEEKFVTTMSIFIFIILPVLFLIEMPILWSLLPPLRIRNIDLQGPWLLPAIYAIWCIAYLIIIHSKRSARILSTEPSTDFIENSGLTPRETEVLILLIQGKSYKQITDICTISMATVKTHVSSIYRKTQTANRLELAIKAANETTHTKR